MTDIFSTPPFNTEYVKQRTADDLPTQLATHKYLHYFQHALGAIDGSHIPIKAPAQYWEPVAIGKALYHKIAFLFAPLIFSSLMRLWVGKDQPRMPEFTMKQLE